MAAKLLKRPCMLRPCPQPPHRVCQLRYTFDTWQQAKAHLHSIEGRLLLFYPDSRPAAPVGEKVLLEISLLESDQPIALAGRLHARGDELGVWIELFAPRVLDGLRLTIEGSNRRFRRVATDRMVRVRGPSAASIGRLVEVGLGGARVVHVAGEWPAGEEVGIDLLETKSRVRGRTLRCCRGELAVEFARVDPGSRAAVADLVAAEVRSWERAPQARHPSACRCGAGDPLLEPLPPRVATHRRVDAA